MLFGSRFSVTLLYNLADFVAEIHFGHEKPEHANAAPIVSVFGRLFNFWFVRNTVSFNIWTKTELYVHVNIMSDVHAPSHLHVGLSQLETYGLELSTQ